MSVDEVEPIEEENAVATRGTHLASTQTITHEYLTHSGKVIHKVFLQFPNLNLEQNPSLTALAI